MLSYRFWVLSRGKSLACAAMVALFGVVMLGNYRGFGTEDLTPDLVGAGSLVVVLGGGDIIAGPGEVNGNSTGDFETLFVDDGGTFNQLNPLITVQNLSETSIEIKKFGDASPFLTVPSQGSAAATVALLSQQGLEWRATRSGQKVEFLWVLRRHPNF